MKRARLVINAATLLGGLMLFGMGMLPSAGAVEELPGGIDWPAFMRQHDMTFDKLPANWKQAPHFGNAMVGSMLYAVQRPGNLWPLDATGLGGNDFSSTKVGIQEASLADRTSNLRVISDGHQSVRAFRDGEQTGLFVTGFHTGGGDRFFSRRLAAERKPLNDGSEIADTITLHLTD